MNQTHMYVAIGQLHISAYMYGHGICIHSYHTDYHAGINSYWLVGELGELSDD